MDQCEICCARVRELRRGRCWGCYSRWVESRPVGLGASCRLCGERRRSYLKSIELFGSWSPLCHNCAGRVAALERMPRSIAGIRALLERERRSGARRAGHPDARAFPYERRGPDRRATAPDRVDEEMIVEIAELAHDLATLAAELPDPERSSDLTAIRELLPAPRP